MYVIELFHPTDPRFLLVEELPEEVTIDDLSKQRYGKLLLFSPIGSRFASEVTTILYEQPDGPGEPWKRT